MLKEKTQVTNLRACGLPTVGVWGLPHSGPQAIRELTPCSIKHRDGKRKKWYYGSKYEKTKNRKNQKKGNQF